MSDWASTAERRWAVGTDDERRDAAASAKKRCRPGRCAGTMWGLRSTARMPLTVHLSQPCMLR